MPDIGIPHPGLPADSPDDFVPADPDSDVGEPNALGAQEGFPHPGLPADVPDDFTPTDPDSDVGQPGGVA